MPGLRVDCHAIGTIRVTAPRGGSLLASARGRREKSPTLRGWGVGSRSTGKPRPGGCVRSSTWEPTAARYSDVDEPPPRRDARRARADLGRVVHVHQGRRARAGPGDADRGADRAGGADARARSSRRSLGARRTLDGAAALRAAARRSSALVNTAIPFWLLSWGETRIDSGLAAIIQAAVPIFMAVFALRLLPAERVDGLRLAGVLRRLRRRRAARRRAAGGADPRRARGRRDGDLLRDRRPARRAAPERGVRRSSSRSAPMRRRRRSPCSARAIAQAPGTVPGWKAIALGRRARRRRHRGRLPALLRDRSPAPARRAPGSSPTSCRRSRSPTGRSSSTSRIGAAALAGLVLILGGVALGTRRRRPATVEA